MATTSSSLEQYLNALSPKSINYTKCTPATSIYHKISQQPHKKRRLDHQDKQWFNLGNGQTFNDPITAAEYLLEREYGESFLFKPNQRRPVIIPSEFMSNQYHNESKSAVLDFNIEQTVKQTLIDLQKNRPNFWFTGELEAFLQAHPMNPEINQKEFESWIIKVKAIYLMRKEIKPEEIPQNLPMIKPSDFVNICITELKKSAQTSSLINGFSGRKSFKYIAKEVVRSPPQDRTVKWFFDLQISDRGESAERSFFDELYSLKDDDILKDTVILSSLNFLTDLDNKEHQEFDFLIFSWKRKLIIGVEAKRQLTNTTAFKQLDKYRSIFEEKLGDQLGPGWTFYPGVFVEKKDSSLSTTSSNNHFIDMDTDIYTWISSVFNSFPENVNGQSLEQLKKVLQIIIFTVHMSTKDKPRLVTSSYWVDYISDVIDSLSSTQNIVFYSQQQLPLMITNDPKYNKVIFMAGFGTGKTFLLEEKAITLSEQAGYRGGVCYVVCNGMSLHYYERKLKLEQHGIKVVYEIEDLLDKTSHGISHIKAIFFDEFDTVPIDIFNELKTRLLTEIPVCWVAPNCSYRVNYELSSINNEIWVDFQSVSLNLNLRNTKEIANKALSVGEQKIYRYADGLSSPPLNFPNGPSPTYAASIDDAIKKVRAITKKGILLVTDNYAFNLKIDEKVRFHDKYPPHRKDSPIDFLKKGGILVASRDDISGFEWPVVIYQLNKTDEEDIDIERHECNMISRCTSLLYIVGEENNTNINYFPYNKILKMLELLTADNTITNQFKRSTRHYVFDHLHRFNRREWLQELQPILKETIEQISQVKTITFSMLEKLLLFLIQDVFRDQEAAWFSVPCAMSLLFVKFIDETVSFDEWLSKCVNIKFFSMLDSHTLLTRLSGISPEGKTTMWKYFEIENLPEVHLPEVKILKILKSDSENLKLFKFVLTNYVFDHLERFNRRWWLQELQPVLKETIEQISQAKNDTITFSLLEKLLLFLIKDLTDFNHAPFMKSALEDFNAMVYYYWLDRYFNLNYLELREWDVKDITFYLEIPPDRANFVDFSLPPWTLYPLNPMYGHFLEEPIVSHY
ncbi:uncharacterized protein [Clytia hemisphaerica]|uniref:Uncharacterized protein n=1 Tax=Clytia hemisphaerica TaxID=252671 RepID=A0A7M6DRE6_9CNID